MNRNHNPSLRLLHGLVLLATAFASYSGGLGNEFISNWDDSEYVVNNPDIQALNLANLAKIFSSFYVGNYAPLQMLSYMLDYILWGPNPTAFLLVNIILHAVNGILFYRILCRLDLQPWLALAAALLFIVHPVQVESVAWISQRKNVLSMLFFLTAFSCYLSYLQNEGRKTLYFSSSVALFLFALLTKSVTVILPAVLLAYDFTLREDRDRLQRIIVEKVPFALLAAVFSWGTLVSQNPAEGGGMVAQHGGSSFATFLTMLTVYKEYLYNLFWPLHLSAAYHVDIKKGFDAEVIASAALLLSMLTTVLLFRAPARRKGIFWLSLFFIGFLPVSQIVPIITLMNDRYCYIPLLGLSVYLVLLLQELADRWQLPDSRIATIIAICLLLLFPITWRRTTIWSDPLTLWQDAAAKQPLSACAWSHLGYAQEYAGDREKAISSYQTAARLDPDDAENFADLGILLNNAGDYTGAIRSLREALRLEPGHRVWIDLALAYTRSLQHSTAIAFLQERGESSEGALALLAINHYHLGQYGAAFRYYRQMQNLYPGLTAAEASAAMALIALRMQEPGLYDELWRHAITNGINPATIYLNWARLEAIGNRQDESLQWLEKALAHGTKATPALYSDPDFANLRGNPHFTRLMKKP